jgi:hypothetical protein
MDWPNYPFKEWSTTILPFEGMVNHPKGEVGVGQPPSQGG